MKKLSLFSLMLLFVFVFGACTPSVETENPDTLHVVTSLYPMYIAALNLTENVESITLTNLSQDVGGCLHDYQLKPSDLRTLSEADLFVINGGGMEEFLEKTTSELKDLEIIDASEGLSFLADEHGHPNAHIWLSIPDHISQVNNIAKALIKHAPNEAEKISENQAKYVEVLSALDLEMHDALDALKGKNMITFHEAFPYFAESFGLNIVSVIEEEPGSLPGAGELSRIVTLIKDGQVDAIFAEPQYSKKALETISAETGMTVYTLDPIVSGEMSKTAYVDIMRQNLQVLKEALE